MKTTTMSGTQIPAMWDEAVKRYETITKKSLKQIPWPSSPEDLIRDVEGSVKQCEEFLGRAATFFTIFRNVGGTIATVGNVVAGAAQGAFPASPMIFGCVVYLIDAAKGVSRCLDAITDLLQILQNFTVRLKIYHMVEISELKAPVDEYCEHFESFEGNIAIAAEQTNQLQWLEQYYQDALDRARQMRRTNIIAKLTLGLANFSHKFVGNKRRAVKLWRSLVLPNAFSHRAGLASVCSESAILALSLHYMKFLLQKNDLTGESLGQLVEF
jgi:hypothetical protein